MTGIAGSIGAGSRSGVVGRLLVGSQIGSGTSNPGSYAGYAGPFLELRGAGPTVSLHDTGTGTPQWEIAAYQQALRISDDGVDRVRILSTGGLAFGSDSAEANALDDYEEGTWNASFSNENTDSGTYTKIGRLVFCTAYLTTTSGGAAGVTIGGLPFTSASTTDSRGGGVAVFQSENTSHTVTVFVNDNNTTFTLRLANSDINLGASKTAWLSFNYITA